MERRREKTREKVLTKAKGNGEEQESGFRKASGHGG